MVLAMAECFVLVLGEIDLSVGFVGPLGGIITVQLVQPSTTNWPWWAAIIAALLDLRPGRRGHGHADHPSARAVIHRHPGWLPHLQRRRPDRPELRPLLGLSQPDRQLDEPQDDLQPHVRQHRPGGELDRHDRHRRRAGAGPVAARCAPAEERAGGTAGRADAHQDRFIAVVGVVVVAICNVNRAHFGTIAGVPWVIPIVLGVLARVDGAAGADPLRPLPLRHRRQRRSGAPCRREPRPDSHHRVHPVLGDRRARRHAVRRPTSAAPRTTSTPAS